jgi:hypothetical protein
MVQHMKKLTLLLLTFIPFIGFSQGWLIGISLSNTTPSGCDAITATITGYQQCGNSTATVVSTVVNGATATITIDDVLPGPICLPSLVQFSLTSGSFTLPSGADTVIVILLWNGQFKESMQTTVSVSGGGFSSQSIDICQDDSLFVGGAWQTQAGTYYDTLFGTSCDTVIETILGFKQYETVDKSTSVCFGDSAFLGGAWQHIPGIYADTLDMSMGCDSIFLTTLSVVNTDSTIKTPTICEGETYWAGGANQTVAGTYYDFHTNSAGCDSIVKTILTVDDVPNKPSIQPIGQDSLRSSVGGTHYDWFFNGIKLGVHTRSISLDFYGDFQVLVYNNNCLSDTSEVYTAQDPTIGMGESGLTDYRIYPNPADGQFIVEGFGMIELRLLDLKGDEVLHHLLIDGLNKIILPDLAAGLYIVEVSSTSGVERSRVVIQ